MPPVDDNPPLDAVDLSVPFVPPVVEVPPFPGVVEGLPADDCALPPTVVAVPTPPAPPSKLPPIPLEPPLFVSAPLQANTATALTAKVLTRVKRQYTLLGRAVETR